MFPKAASFVELLLEKDVKPSHSAEESRALGGNLLAAGQENRDFYQCTCMEAFSS